MDANIQIIYLTVNYYCLLKKRGPGIPTEAQVWFWISVSLCTLGLFDGLNIETTHVHQRLI